MDKSFTPPPMERRQIYGLTMEQLRNNHVPSTDHLTHIVSQRKTISDETKRDMLVALISLKYTQSNSVCFVHSGMVVGSGAGQQSRIHCTRLAASKSDLFWLRHHPTVLGLKFKPLIKRADKANAIDLFLSRELESQSEESAEKKAWLANFQLPPQFLTSEERGQWLDGRDGVVVASDAFFPFSDNIFRAHRSGASFVVAPGGSVQDDVVVEAVNACNMVFAMTNTRLFHH